MMNIRPPFENAKLLTYYFNVTFGDSNILVCPLKRNGSYDFDRYEKIIREKGYQFPSYERRDIEPESRDTMNDEVRRIITPVQDVKVPEAKDLVIFDDSIKSGGTIFGALAWALENRDELKFEKVYVVASYDLIGVAHFSLYPGYDSWRGLVDVMKNGVPERHVAPYTETLERLEKNDLLSAIGEFAQSENDLDEDDDPIQDESGLTDAVEAYSDKMHEVDK